MFRLSLKGGGGNEPEEQDEVGQVEKNLILV